MADRKWTKASILAWKLGQEEEMIAINAYKYGVARKTPSGVIYVDEDAFSEAELAALEDKSFDYKTYLRERGIVEEGR